MPDDNDGSDEESITQGESEISETDVGSFATPKRHIVTYKPKKTQQERMAALEKAMRGFRIASAGDGLLRGGFGKLPNRTANLEDLEKAVSKFWLVGDGLNVTGSFDKGFAVSRENPCEQQQVNPNPI